MKKLLLIASLFIVVTAQAQTKAVKDKDGNYTSVSQRDISKNPGTPTGHTFTDSKGKVYPLLISSRGRLFYFRTSRTGNVYKVYIKED